MNAQRPIRERTTVADYLVRRLREHGVEHVFGVPGDFVLTLFEHLENATDITLVNTCDEQGAGFAADAYARLRGLGVVCVTYGVGALKIANSTAQAYAEEVPVVVISGAPSRTQRASDHLLHHVIKGFDNQHRVFEHLTVATAVIDDTATACREIDRAIDAALLYKRPVYIELPRDLTLAEVDPGLAPARPISPRRDEATLAAAVTDAIAQLRASTQPAVFVGLEAVRFELLDQVRELIERHAFPAFVMPLSKSAISEQHPCFGGVYGGAMSRSEVREFVESADCLFMIGSLMTDLDLGGNTAHLATERTILVSRDRVRIAHRTYENVQLEDFLQALLQADLPDFSPVMKPVQVGSTAWVPQPQTAVTVSRLFERLGTFLDESTIVIADPGDATFGALDLPVRQSYEFLANAFYASLGFAVPASIGAQLAMPNRRPLVLVGDGAFQMTGVELSTSLRYGLNPIVVILNNRGYLTERLLIDGDFNDILPWRYDRLPEVFGAGRSFIIDTEEDLEIALTTAEASNDLCILDVHLDPHDASPALRRLAEGLNAQVGPVVADSI
jgi:indolepyruvate decarboxylase